MGIFTKEYDRVNVPLVVQLAQIDTDDEAELYHAVALVFGDDGELHSEHTNDPSRACSSAYSLLYALATNTGIPAPTIGWVNSYHYPEYAIAWDLKSKIETLHDREEGLVALNELSYESVDLEPYSFEIVVASELQKVLYAAWSAKRDAPPVAGICPECKNPFLYPTDRHIFCSRRCADRTGQKRRRKNKA